MLKRKFPEIAVVPLIALLIYFQVFFADYIYTDEANQLWHNHDGMNYSVFTVQGRWFAGFLFNKLFALLSTASEIKFLRIFSLTGWILFVFAWQYIFRLLAQRLNIEKRLVQLTGIFIICSIPVSICIGWTACMQLFIGSLMALVSSHLWDRFMYGMNRDKKLFFFFPIGSLVAGVTSLFFYQSSFGLFLLPFFLQYLKSDTLLPGKTVMKTVLFYFIVYIFYYLIFKYSLSVQNYEQVNRAKISTDILGKLSFLFSDPLPSSFSLNILYTARSIFSQVFAPVMMALWAIMTFIRYRKNGILPILFRLILTIIFLAIIYLPSMVVSENFASYRTLFAMNLAVFCLLTDSIFSFIKLETTKNIFTVCLSLFLIATGFYNFNNQFINPLKNEYKAFTGFMSKNLSENLQTVYFIRADRFMFSPYYHTLPYKDEFGLPSTNKDWVPESLVKQSVFELTGDRHKAEKINVVQFADLAEYKNASIQLSGNDLLVDMNKIFSDYQKEKQ
ncbi:MAG: hypothetical protein QM764_11305 [Chitinophagaceae bacterium]